MWKNPHFFLREGLVTPVQSTELICTLAFSCTLTQWCLEEEHQSGKPYGSVGTVARNSSGIVMDSEQGPAYFKLRGKKCSVLEDKAIGQLKPCCFTRSEMWLICSYTARNLKEKINKAPLMDCILYVLSLESSLSQEEAFRNVCLQKELICISELP